MNTYLNYIGCMYFSPKSKRLTNFPQAEGLANEMTPGRIVFGITRTTRCLEPVFSSTTCQEIAVE